MADELKYEGQREVRVGLLLDATSVPAWVRRVIEELLSEQGVRLVVAVVNMEASGQITWSKIKRRASQLLFRLYERLDRAIFRETPDPFESRTIADLLDGLTVVRAAPARKGFVHRLDLPTVEGLVEARLDVILRFGFNILRGEILAAAKHGVWSFHHGDERRYRGGPPFFWEMHEGAPTSGIILQILNEELDGGYVIYRSTSRTDPISLSRGRSAAYWKGSHFVTRCLRDLRENPDSFKESRLHLQGNAPYGRAIYRTPDNKTMAVFLVKRACHILVRAWSRLFWFEQWSLGLKQGPQANLLEGQIEFQVVAPSRDRLHADPFPIVREERTFAFFEKLVYRSGKGSISVGEIDSSGSLQSIMTVLEEPHHLSYPFVFQDGGDTYLMPESFDAGELVIYKMLRFPDMWERRIMVAKDLRAVDPTLLKYQDRYWIFCNVASPGMSANDELHIFHAPALEGPWEPHRANPVVSDVRRSRPAGAFLRHDDQLVRPAQDCAGSYGQAIRFQAVQELNTSTYKEEELSSLRSSGLREVTGCHTYNQIAGLTIVDLRLVRPRVSVPGRTHRGPATASLEFLGDASRA